jgi:sugar O-acyltransferase (sialic acid O-acetyltransferase NeuD family)
MPPALHQCIIVGAGGHGRVVLDILRQEGLWSVVGFLDSNPDLHGSAVDGVEVLGPLQMLAGLHHGGVRHAVVAIGDNDTRASFAAHIEARGVTLINAIHPSAQVAATAIMGRGVVIAAGVVVCAHCHIGDGVILNTGCIVDHESRIGASCHVCPGARLAGRVDVDETAFVGIGATIVQRIRIGRSAIVGAGAVVLRDVAAGETVVGVPARAIHDLSWQDTPQA